MNSSRPATAQEDDRLLDALFVGSLFCDLVFQGAPIPDPGQEVYASGFVLTAGGIANASIASARHGLSTGVISLLGGDPLSCFVQSVLERESNLQLDWLGTDRSATIAVSVALTNERDRAFITYEDSKSPRVICPGRPLPAVTNCFVGLGEADLDWVVDLRSNGTCVYAGVGWDATEEWDEKTLALLQHVDVFVPNETEALHYTRSQSIDEAAQLLSQLVPLVVVTLGDNGAMAIDRSNGQIIRVPAVPVAAVDPTGAGDVFVASLMAAGVFGWPLEKRLRFACLSASLSVRSLGGAASAPRPAQIADFISTEKPAGKWDDILAWARSQPAQTDVS